MVQEFHTGSYLVNNQKAPPAKDDQIINETNKQGAKNTKKTNLYSKMYIFNVT